MANAALVPALGTPTEPDDAGGPDADGRCTTCRHCGLDVPHGRDDGFCCSGCRAVFSLLRDAGLTRFYDLGGGAPVGATPRASRLDWLPERIANGRGEDGIVRLSLDLQGIRCAACVWVLQEVWRRRRGGVSLRIQPAIGKVDLAYDPDQLDLVAYLADVERLGYRVAPSSKETPREERSLVVRFGVCAAASMNAMMFAAAGYTGMAADDPAAPLFEALGFVLATLAFVVGAPVFLRSALGGLRQRVLHLDLPIAIGLVLAYGGSVVLWLQGAGGSYFDTVTIFLTLMLLGRYLQQRAVRRNRDFLLRNDGAEHMRVQRLVGGALQSTPVRDVRPGDRLWLTPGDLVPVRVRLVGEAATFSLDWIQGESAPRPFAAEAEVPAGAFLTTRQPVVVEALADVEASGLLRLLAEPDTRTGNAGQTSRRDGFWSRLNRGYVAAVLILASVGAVVWAFVDPQRILPVTISLLVVTCPCALGIATPLAFDLAVGGLRRRGVFVRTIALLDKIRHVRKVFFDKTGTLTSGGATATVLRAPPPELRELLRTMAAASRHPASRAIHDVMDEAGPIRTDLVVREIPGSGLEAVDAGGTYRLGSPRFVLAADEGQDGLCLFSRDGHVEAAFVVAEQLHPGAADEIAALRARGMEVAILTGDRRDRAMRAASALRLPESRVHAEMTPEQKAAYVAANDHADTLMVGDGLNDGPAFAAAFCAGTPAIDRPVMPSKADFAFAGAGSGAVLAVHATGLRLCGVVRRNLRLSSIYNVTAVALSLAGWMTPLLCAVLMPLSSLTLIAHTSLAMRRRLPHEGRT